MGTLMVILWKSTLIVFPIANRQRKQQENHQKVELIQ